MTRGRHSRRRLGARALAGCLVLLALSPAGAWAVTNNTPPSISPGAEPKREGQVLTANDGTWTFEDPSSQSITREWIRCDGTGQNCNTVVGTGTTYTPSAADVGNRLLLLVTATCTGCAPATKDAALTGVIRTDPSNESPPVVGGTFREGETVGGLVGDWSGTQPISYAVNWQRCATSEPESCEHVPGATDLGYRLTSADVGLRMRLVVVADSPGPGAITAVSAHERGRAAPQAPAVVTISLGGNRRSRTSARHGRDAPPHSGATRRDRRGALQGPALPLPACATHHSEVGPGSDPGPRTPPAGWDRHRDPGDKARHDRQVHPLPDSEPQATLALGRLPATRLDQAEPMPMTRRRLLAIAAAVTGLFASRGRRDRSRPARRPSCNPTDDQRDRPSTEGP